MPSPPEIRERRAQIRIVEILRKFQADHQPEADGHAAVAGEIEIQMQRVSRHRDDRIARRRRRQGVSGIDQRRERVADQYLLRKAQHEPTQAFGKLCGIEHTGFQPLCDRLVPDDRTCHEMTEHRLVGRIVDEARLGRDGLSEHVDRIGYGAKHEERQSDRQRNRRPILNRCAETAHALDNQIDVFETDQAEQRRHDPCEQGPTSLRSRRFRDPQARQPGPAGDRDEQRQKIEAPPAIEHQAEEQDGRISEKGGDARIGDQEQRQENEDE